MLETSRRRFIQSSVALAAGASVLSRAALAHAGHKPKLRKAVKFGMIGEGSTVEEKLALIKELGFEGVEIDSPSGVNVDEAVAAAQKTGVTIHGVIDSVHWTTRLSDPDAAVRAKGLEALRGAIKDAKTYGATTVLLVPGAVKNKETENFEQVWQRSQEQVRQAIPDAKAAGVHIAIEVVWNDFITKPEQLVKYVDDFQDPIIGAYFDVSNMIKYGVPPADWIRALGKRMLKFDFKGYSNEKKWVDIGDGDENWPEVLKALGEIGYDGWATSEVKGGDRAHLADVSKRMDRVLGLA